jgi:CRP-like cAMP-binding protein
MSQATAHLEDLLTGVALFGDLTGQEAAQVAAVCRLIEALPGDRLIREGQAVQTIYVFLAGEAAVMKENHTVTPVEVACVRKGGVLGEMSLLDNAPAFATVIVKEPVKAVAIDHEPFTRLLDQFPRIGYKVFKRLARTTSLRLKMTTGRLAEFAELPNRRP